MQACSSGHSSLVQPLGCSLACEWQGKRSARAASISCVCELFGCSGCQLAVLRYQVGDDVIVVSTNM